jgi:hypothetical protein
MRHLLRLLALALPLAAADIPRQAPELVINTPGGNPVKLSQYKGKAMVVCFILTTCPHCQKTIGLLTPLQKEYGPRGFQVLSSAINQGSALLVPEFVRTFMPTFPVGFDDPSVAVDFMQHPPAAVPYMPMIAFIDRQGMIREQHEGNDEAYFNDQQEQHLRKSIEALLNPPAAAAKKKK